VAYEKANPTAEQQQEEQQQKEESNKSTHLLIKVGYSFTHK
jgi:hypothetical protein